MMHSSGWRFLGIRSILGCAIALTVACADPAVGTPSAVGPWSGDPTPATGSASPTITNVPMRPPPSATVVMTAAASPTTAPSVPPATPSRTASPTPPATVTRVALGQAAGATATPVLFESTPVAPAPLAPEATAAVAARTGSADSATGDPVAGKLLFEQKGCILCHGEMGEGLVGPRIARTKLTYQEVLAQVRNPRGVMQQFQPADISDAEVLDIYAYLQSLP